MAADLRAGIYKFCLKFTPPYAHESDLIVNQIRLRALV